MIVQSPEVADGPSFVLLQTDHTRFAGALHTAFGNDEFAAPKPADLIQFAIDSHDEGWAPLDERLLFNEGTGLPYHLTGTPLPELIGTSVGSPDLNERRHPFCGVLSSMHTYGLYTGRYGLSAFVFVDVIPAELRGRVDAMLANEVARQERLKDLLRADADPAVAALADETLVMHAYKLLQVWDTLSLYLQCEHPSLRGQQTFPNMPRSANPADDVTLTVTPVDVSDAACTTYRVAPFPFRSDGVEVSMPGRYLAPTASAAAMRDAFATAPIVEQRVRFVA